MRSIDESDRRTSDETEATAGRNGKRRQAKERSFWRELPILILLALGLALLIKTFLIQAFYIPSESMERTLVPGDRVLVNKLAYRIGDIQRGDVIVFNGTGSWESEVVVPEPSNPVEAGLRKLGELFGFATAGEKDFIKRVIGLPGDRVMCCDAKDRIVINGKPLDESSYLYPGNKPSEMRFDIKVPPGRVWVMGDHRLASSDSREHLGDPGGGTIRTDHVLGRAFVIVWPVDRVTLLNRPAAYAEAGLASGAVTGAAPAVAAVAVVAPLAAWRWRRSRGVSRRG
ncbi:MAG TPA: signal peptidase I [Actinopolymorphaceae bacterium]